MFGEHNQAAQSLPSAGHPNPFAGIHMDPQALLAYANMIAAYAQQQLQQAVVRQHPVAMPSPLSPSPKLPAAKRAPLRASLRLLIACVLLGAVGGFYARGQLLQQQASQQLSRQ